MRGFEPDRRRLLKTASGAVLGLTTLSGNVSGQSSNTATAATAPAAETPTVTYDVDTLPANDDLVELTITLSGPASLSDAVDSETESIFWNLSQGTDFRESNATGISNEWAQYDHVFEWDGETLPATVTVRYQPSTATHDLNRQRWVADDWALLSVVSSYPETVSLVESVSGAGERAGSIVFAGSHNTHERVAHRQTVRLVVPEAATLYLTPTAVLDSLSYQSRHLRIGNRQAEHTVVTGPDPIARSYSSGDHAVVTDETDLDDNAWGHEYVHTRQAGRPATSTAWLLEAEPSYYDILLAYKREDVAWDGDVHSFQRQLDISEDIYGDVRLTQVGANSSSQADYEKGALVIAALDARIRTDTDGERSYQDVLRLINRRYHYDAPDALEHEAYVALLEEVAGTSMTEFADRYIDGTEIPPVPADQSLYTRGETDFDVAYSTDFEYPDSSPPGPGELVMVQATLETTGTDPSVGPTVALDWPEGWTFQNASRSLQVPADAPEHTKTASWTTVDEARYTTAEFAPGDRLEISALFQVADSTTLTGEESVALSVTDADEHSVTTSTRLADHFLYAMLDLPDEGVAGSPATLDASVTPTPAGTEITSYAFSFDGQQRTTDEPTITHTFDAAGTYDVSVTVETADGQTDTATASLTVVEDDGDGGGTTTTDDGNSGGGGDGTTTTDDGDGGCFITTATANEAATLNSLRRFRDESMAVTPLGRALVGLYYRLSPPIADTLERHPDSRTAGWTRAIVNRCATLSNSQERTDSTVRSVSLGVLLTLLYVAGVSVAATGHAAIRASELRE